ncbi:MAG: diguanylate cyclase [Eubacterium sp.]|nr:diguanylate cyclase [Eubacterium sp.]
MKIKKLKSLSFSIPILFITSYIVIAVIIVLAVYFRFENRMIQEYTRMAEGVTNLMANAYDAEKTDLYIEENYSLPEYMETLKYFYTLKDNYPDIYYMYIYRFDQEDPPTATVVIDLDEEYTDNPPQDSIDWIGDTYEVDEPFASEIHTILNSADPVVHTVHTQDNEYLLSYVRPVLDDEGNYLCSVCVDFSMNTVQAKDLNFLYKLMSILGLVMLGILILNILITRRKLTQPLNMINQCIGNFNYETESGRFENLNQLESLQIERQDEIGMLYNSFVLNLKESLYYMSNYNKAVDEIEYKDREIESISLKTYKDPLTGVNNKIAYENDIAVWNTKMESGLTDISVLMVDANNLKYINDTYGHEKGDLYLQGCCKIICDIYKKSPVYRIGGDEFVVLLEDHDYQHKDELYAKAIDTFSLKDSQQVQEPWKKYSASVGMATYKSGDTIETLVSRADKAMYENKVEFKKQFGNYR